jgi:MoaA/NifB/PqqE/SkfB family radical SAM enzyme
MNLLIPDVRTLEVHPAPWSNLRTSCRTSSSLEERNGLGVPLLLHAINDAADLGYNFLNVAGDEPLLYSGLSAVCREAHRRRMLTSMIIHSVSPTSADLDWLRFSIDLLGIAIDPRTVRPKPGRRTLRAAQLLDERLDLVRRSGIAFAIVVALTRETLSDLEWAAEFAASQGAAMLQIRPVPGLSDERMSTAWMMAECLGDLYRGRVVIHLDATNRYNLPIEPADLDSWRRDIVREARYLGEILSPLVIEHTGDVAPIRFGFPRRFAFGNLHQERLAKMTRRWIEMRSADFCSAYGAALEKARTADRTFGDLFEMFSDEPQGVRGMSAATS